jgi:predicted nucleic acid-binding Zn ribbon protein
MYCPSCSKQIPDESVACNFCGKPLRPKKRTSWAAVMGFGLLALILIWFLIGKVRTSSTSNRTVAGLPGANSRTLYIVPHEEKLIGERITVKAGSFSSRDFTITDHMEEARLVARFEASGGSGDNIQVCVATADEFRNWINGNQARVLYSRKATVDSFNVDPLPPGKYTIGFSNKHALLFSRDVTADVTLHYTTREYR